MKFFGFLSGLFGGKKDDMFNEQVSVPRKRVREGRFREREYILPSSNFTRNTPEFLMTLEGERKDDVRVGRWTVKDKDGNTGYINYDEYGLKHGLEKLPVGGYTLYHHGQAIKSNYELIREWKRILKEWKMVKEADKDGRSEALKKVLEAKTKEGKKEVLRKFHAQKTPNGQPRRTALKFNKKSKGSEI